MATFAVIGFTFVFLIGFVLIPRAALTLLLMIFFVTNPPTFLANAPEFIISSLVFLGSMFGLIGLWLDINQAIKY